MARLAVFALFVTACSAASPRVAAPAASLDRVSVAPETRTPQRARLGPPFAIGNGSRNVPGSATETGALASAESVPGAR